MRVLHAPSNRRVRPIILALSLTVLLCAPAKAQGDSTTNGSDVVAQASINPQTIRLPMTDGNDIRFLRTSDEAGMSQIRVAHQAQDDQGFMWFGTQYGLDRYDGYKFKAFTPDPTQVNSLSGGYVYSLFKDRSGALWVGCDQFLDRFDAVRETFTHYRIGGENSSPLSSVVVHISQDRAGVLWLATGRGLYGVLPDTGRIIHHFIHDPLNPASLSSNDVELTTEDRSGKFWIVDGGNVEEFDRGSGKVKLRIPLGASLLESSFCEDHLGVLWIGYTTGEGSGGLAGLDRKTHKLTHYSFYDSESGQTVQTGVSQILEDQQGILWLATMGQGLLKFDRENGRLIRYRNHPGEPDSLAEDRVISLAEDREGNIWAGLYAKAPNFFATQRPSFRPVLPEGINPNSIGENMVNAIYEDRQGLLWVGTTASLIRIDRKTGKYISYRPPGSGMDNDIVSITEDHSGIIWVGANGHGLYRFDPRTGQFRVYQHNPADHWSLSNNTIIRLFIDRAGTMWLATWNGLDRFDSATGRFAVYKRDPHSQSEQYYDIAEDKSGAFWLGGNSGLQRFDPATGKFKGFEHQLGVSSSLSDERVTSVAIDHSGQVWAATHSGLDRLDRKNATFTTYYSKDGLASNRVHCLLEDQRGVLWMSTSRGISSFDPVLKTFKNYSMADGLPGTDLTGWRTCFESPAGEMFFGGFSGATAFYPDQVGESSYVPRIVLTDFRLAGVSVNVGAGSPLKKSISYTRSLVLTHQQSMFSLEFSALSYSNSAMNRYRYMLRGLDSDWHQVGSEERLVSYTTLPPRIYEFRVQGATSTGPWSEPGVALQIEILPPWWGMWWFRVACAATLVLLAWSAYYYRLNQVAQRFNVRLAERTRIARELHDTLLQSFHGLTFRFQAARNMLPGRPEEAIQALDGALIRADQALAESQDAIHDLRSEPVAQGDLAYLLKVMGQELGGSQNANRDSPNFLVTVEGERQTVSPILQDEIYRIAREVLRNAFRHARASQIEAEIRYDDRLLRLRIRDNGRGIDPEVLKEGGRAGHWGLPGIRERAERIGARLDFWSEAGAGTEVELTVPADAAYETSPARRRSWFSGESRKLKVKSQR